jgi:hypothetical protein
MIDSAIPWGRIERERHFGIRDTPDATQDVRGELTSTGTNRPDPEAWCSKPVSQIDLVHRSSMRSQFP